MAGTALPARAAVTSRGITIPDFYTPPVTLPAADGSLVRTEPLPLALALPGIDGTLPGRATRIMYKSTDSAGNPVAVTGAYLEPAACWKGTRPLVVLAPGTMGQGDQCSTSLALQRWLVLGACRARRRPHGQARALASSWCRLGGSVVYAPVTLPWTVSPLLNHFGPLLTDQGPAVDWLTRRLAGSAAQSSAAQSSAVGTNCGLMPLLP